MRCRRAGCRGSGRGEGGGDERVEGSSSAAAPPPQLLLAAAAPPPPPLEQRTPLQRTRKPSAPAAPSAAAAPSALLLLLLVVATAAPPPGARAQICSTTIQYGASIGDTVRAVSSAELPIFVGSFSILSQDPAVNVSSWVLGWQFGAGETIQLQRDVFGDPGVFDVFLSSGQQQAAVVPGAAGQLPSQMHLQRVAVFSE